MNRASSLSSHSSATTTTSGTTSNQFRHTYLWNNIIQHLKTSLLQDAPQTSNPTNNTYSNRLRKQHSRFVTSGMLIIKQNLLSSTGLTLNSNCLDNICFTGAQCVDIVYGYLTSKEQMALFERQVTRDKVTKLCQTIMDSGVFEPVSRSCTRFDDTLMKFYRFKGADESQKRVESKDDVVLAKADSGLDLEDVENSGSSKNIVGMAFNKCKMMNKASMSNTKLKRKVTSMKRSSTIQSLMPVENIKPDNEPVSVTTSRCDILQRIDSNTIDTTHTTLKSMPIKLEPPTKLKYTVAAQDLLLTRQITRELVVERLLHLIDLPIVEQLLVIDEWNDVDYRQLVREGKKAASGSKTVDENQNMLVVKSNSICQIEKSLAILSLAYDLSKCDTELEWRKSAMEVLEFIDVQGGQRSQQPITCTTTDLQLYHLIKDYYTLKRTCFLDDSFQPLFVHILSFLRHTHYMKALETLNYGTLLLLKQTQAELKRLLKFLYLTANFTNAPKITEHKQNNSILLNHFAQCLFNSRLITFEESRLILNFMLNNFDNLFSLSACLEEAVAKRIIMAQQFGNEEALLEKIYCQKVTVKEYAENAKDHTSDALVDLINHIVDNPLISLKKKKLKLKALQRIHPDIYQKHFSDLF